MPETKDWLLLLVVVNLALGNLHAQNLPGISWHGFSLKNEVIPNDFGGELPVKLSTHTARSALALALGTALLAKADREIDEEYAIDREYGPFSSLKWFGKTGKFYDMRYSSPAIAGLMGAAWLYGRYAGKENYCETVGQMTQSLILTTLVTSTLKTTVGRHRPYTNNGPFENEMFDFTLKSDYMSFPSGHTSSIFALLTVLAKRSESRWIQTGAYSLAASVGFQRMMYRKHWASDVLVGGFIGYSIANWVVYHGQKAGKWLRISPFLGGKTAGVSLHL
ncbi:MAG: phosphatase PAP2 family protein [Calditrichaeota bacterium]|nr:phosphatase PAP2 family protein [Calditrichota bacterium]HQU70911.1 phosphatase PAP2 family protein [Calditrichia bacterium]